MPRGKRGLHDTRARRAAAAAAPASPSSVDSPSSSPSTSPTAALFAAVSLSAPSSPEEPATDSDQSDADPAPRPRKQRRKLEHYHRRLTDQERLDILEQHIYERKTAPAIAALCKDKGLIVPVSTIYTIIRRQARGEPLGPKPRHRRTKYTAEDAHFIVQAQLDHNDWHYDDLRRAWREAHPDRTDAPCNYTIHKFLIAANITSKQLVLVPVGRNTPQNIEARYHYSLEAMKWPRERVVFIDETTFSKDLHPSRGRSEKGTLATYRKPNSPGSGIKVCAAVSPVFGMVMYRPALTAYTGDMFARFMNDLCKHPLIQQQSCIFIVDNVYIHFTQEVKDAMAGQAMHHDMQRLPTYSPHLNPIEYCFYNWKTEIKHIDQVVDHRSLKQQVDDTRTCITPHLVSRILDHVFQLYAHCLERKELEEFKPIGHRVARSQVDAQLQRNVIAATAEEEHKE